MTGLERLGLALLHRMDPETAHDLSLKALRAGLAPRPGPVTSDPLKTTLAGMTLPNPVGLAAGYDKNAVALGALTQAGFGWVEVGAATPRPQPGNPKPRLFRLSADKGVINRFGFNNDGMEAIAARLAARPKGSVPIGLNLGANKDSSDRAADYAQVAAQCGPHVDFVTVNVSSPNTEKLRDLQGPDALRALLDGVMTARPDGVLVFLKIAPDLGEDELDQIAAVAQDRQIDAIIATNTTLDRQGLVSAQGGEAGGLSGQPLFEKSTAVLRHLYRTTQGAMPLIGVGGIASADQAYAKIRAGATAVQLYSGLVYGGLSLVGDIARGLEARLKADGLTLEQAVGADA